MTSPSWFGRKILHIFLKKPGKSLLLNFVAHLNLNTIKFICHFHVSILKILILSQCPSLYISWAYHELWYNNEQRSP